MPQTELNPYPAYGNSGVEWLGDVPAHWEVRRLKGWLGVNERVLGQGSNKGALNCDLVPCPHVPELHL